MRLAAILPCSLVLSVLSACAMRQVAGEAGHEAATDESLAIADSRAPSSRPVSRRACGEPALALHQEFEGEDLGLGPLQQENQSGNQGPGVAVGDLDGDGWLDAFLASSVGASVVLRNDGLGNLVRDETANVAGEPLPRAIATSLADVDGDGDLDVVLGKAKGMPDQILYNEGGFSFSGYALPDSTGESKSTSLADVDGDGDLDIFIAGFAKMPLRDAIEAGTQVGDGNFLYFQQDDGTFEQVVDALPATVRDAMTYQGAFLDADGDGDLDLYITNDYGWAVASNALMLNDGTGHYSLADGSGAELAIAGMGAAVGDANGDAIPDLYLTDWGRNHLLMGLGDGTFYTATEQASAMPDRDEMAPSWGTSFTDLDQDGWDDLLVIYGPATDEDDGESARDEVGKNPMRTSDATLLANGDGSFRDGSDVTGFIDDGVGRALAIGDLDRDGRPDVVTAGHTFVRTWLGNGGCPPGVTVKLGATAASLGARVTLTEDNRQRTRWLLPGSTYSSSAPELYLGLAGGGRAEVLTVAWMDGERELHSRVSAGTVLDLSWR